jgi:hypothetical protein
MIVPFMAQKLSCATERGYEAFHPGVSVSATPDPRSACIGNEAIESLQRPQRDLQRVLPVDGLLKEHSFVARFCKVSQFVVRQALRSASFAQRHAQ